jgi:hypothetical protein
MYVNQGGVKYGQVNCALCTVAAIFGTTSTQISSMLGLKGHQPEGSFGMAYLKSQGKQLSDFNKLSPSEQLNADFAGMESFVSQLKTHANAPVFVSRGGSWNTPVPLSVQKKMMAGYPEGTQYAVWAYNDVMKGAGAHWNYALRTSGGIVFYDFQYNDAEDHPPKQSDDFIPPAGGAEYKYEYGIVIVFRPKSAKMPWES